jgi:hypothetical protein
MTLERPMFPPSRRGFLAASVAASSAVLTIAPTIPAPAEPLQLVCDPILEAIETHKRAAPYGEREDSARWELTTTTPTTLAGLLALLDYALFGADEDRFAEDDLVHIINGARECLRANISG